MIKFNLTGYVDSLNVDAKKIIKSITKAINKEFNIKSKHIVSFIITNDTGIHDINKTYRNIDAPTDVISFAGIDAEEDRTLPFELGDIFINKDRVFSQANDYGHSEKREFAFLVTHGMLHLLGYDHMNDEDEKEMFALQDKILEKVKISR